MAFKEEYLRPGCPLWIVAQPACSALARKIDWYLNFQIMKSECHHSATTPAELVDIENEWGIEKPEISATGTAPLMILSHALLPNRQTVMVPFSGHAESWVRSIRSVWTGLKSVRMRIFLPDELTKKEFEKAWGTDSLTDVEIVEKEKNP